MQIVWYNPFNDNIIVTNRYGYDGHCRIERLRKFHTGPSGHYLVLLGDL